MLWRVRTTLPDRPGALAALAQRCGEEGVNILGLQIFPGVSGVTDELVLRAPDAWRIADVAELVETAGGVRVTVAACTEHALVDEPIQHLHALRRLAHDPGTVGSVLARLLDADESGPHDPELSAVQDHLMVRVGPHRVDLRRTAPFTATEHARAIAFAEVATELVGTEPSGPVQPDRRSVAPTPQSSVETPVVRLASFDDTPALMRMHERCSADTIYKRYTTPLARVDERMARRLLLAGGGALVAGIDDDVVGIASISTVEAGIAEVTLLVEDGWQRQGLGTALLSSAARLARGHGAHEVVLRSRSHNPALMSLAFASGLRARIRLEGDAVVVTVGVEGLKPLTMVPTARGTETALAPAPNGAQPTPA